MPSEKKHNRLALESSPYLRLHAGNPVDWYPWGEEAFARAREEDRPIFLSIGYSTCYWCHVMERECFSDEDIAQKLNEGFVSIKLDREERPDLDEIYMAATQLLTRSGGWPNSVFLTHELKPFFAGTYFPPRDAMGRPGFPRVLAALRETWALRRGEILAQAEAVADAMREQLTAFGSSGTAPDPGLGDRLAAALKQRFDPRFGGFGRAPKFPSPSNLSFLGQRAGQGDAQAREMLVVTLDHMARGGLQDQLGGGFHRYSTDETWLVPHFEKMLYDNAALAPLYAESAELAPELGFERVSRATLDFVLRELTSPEGAFLSAIDAETDGHEGAYYTWTREELLAHLGGDHDLFASVYGLEGPANFESDRYVLSLPVPFAEAARARGLSEPELEARLAPGRTALKRARDQRPRPLVDDKVLTDWNGLMIGALARAGARLGDERYVKASASAARFVLDRLGSPAAPPLLHVYREGVARVPAFLDDYAFLIQGLLALATATGDLGFAREAIRLQAEQDERLLDAKDGGYYAAGDDARLLIRAKPAFDGALASGNGVSAANLLDLFQRTRDDRYLERAAETLGAFADAVAVAPLGHVTLVSAMNRLAAERPPKGASSLASPPGSGASEDLEETAREVVSVVGDLL
ncbi:MAG TPA: thioredoxin domain-containing protein, partial [Vicinamibacteria bacterium]